MSHSVRSRSRVVQIPGPQIGQDQVAALIERAQQGDREAVDGLYRHYVGGIHRFIGSRVANPDVAEDLTSETFLRMMSRIGTFNWQGADFGAWLVTIARNLVADHFKSGRFRREAVTDRLPEPRERVAGPEEYVLAALSAARVLEALHHLTPYQRACITLRFLNGFTVAETAEAMGRTEGAVKTLQYRAVRALADVVPTSAR